MRRTTKKIDIDNKIKKTYDDMIHNTALNTFKGKDIKRYLKDIIKDDNHPYNAFVKHAIDYTDNESLTNLSAFVQAVLDKNNPASVEFVEKYEAQASKRAQVPYVTVSVKDVRICKVGDRYECHVTPADLTTLTAKTATKKEIKATGSYFMMNSENGLLRDDPTRLYGSLNMETSALTVTDYNTILKGANVSFENEQSAYEFMLEAVVDAAQHAGIIVHGDGQIMYRMAVIGQNASQTRTATVSLAEVKAGETAEDVFKAKACLTAGYLKSDGSPDWEKFVKESGLFDKNGKVNIAKFFARLNCRSASSKSVRDLVIDKNDVELLTIYENGFANTDGVFYISDRSVKVFRKTLSMNIQENEHKLLLKDGESTLTLNDGCGYINTWSRVFLAYAFGKLSKANYEEIDSAFAVVDYDIYSVTNETILNMFAETPCAYQIRLGANKGMLEWFPFESVSKKAIPVEDDNKVTLMDDNGNTVNKDGELVDENGNVIMAVVRGKDIKVLIPDSVHKFHDNGWAIGDLEICACTETHKSTIWTNMQFVQSLSFMPDETSKIDEMTYKKIVNASLDELVNAFKDSKEAQVYFNRLNQSFDADDIVEEEYGNTLANSLAKAVAIHCMLREPTLLKSKVDFVNKTLARLMSGKVPLTGSYNKMLVDPFGCMNQYFNWCPPALEENTYYWNGVEDEILMQRSPLIHPAESRKVKAVTCHELRFFNDCVVFNIYDGQADAMGGGDHDGDGCLVIASKASKTNKCFVNGVRNCGYVISQPGANAGKIVYNFDTLIETIVKGAKRDRTGLLTNYATKWMGIYNELAYAHYYMGKNHIPAIYMLSGNEMAKMANGGTNPSTYDHEIVNYNNTTLVKSPMNLVVDPTEKFIDDNNNTKETVMYLDRYLSVRGFVETEKTPKGIQFKELIPTGMWTRESIPQLANIALYNVAVLRVLQGMEIDGAKTGKYAPDDIVSEVSIKLKPDYLRAYDALYKKNQSAYMMGFNPEDAKTLKEKVNAIDFFKPNTFKAHSPLAEGYKIVAERLDEVTELLNTSNPQPLKTQIVQALGADKYAAFMTVYPEVFAIKTAYSNKITEYMNLKVEGDDSVKGVPAIKEIAVKCLKNVQDRYNVSADVIAAAAYWAGNMSDSSHTYGRSFAWLLADQNLKLFAKYQRDVLVRTNYDDINNVTIENDIFVYNNITTTNKNGDEIIKKNIIYKASSDIKSVSEFVTASGKRFLNCTLKNTVKDFNAPAYVGDNMTVTLLGFNQKGYANIGVLEKKSFNNMMARACEKDSKDSRIFFLRINDIYVELVSRNQTTETVTDTVMCSVDIKSISPEIMKFIGKKLSLDFANSKFYTSSIKNVHISIAQ